MSKIKPIKSDVYKLLQSEIKLHSLADVIRELTQNGIDAGSNHIKVTVKINYIEKAIELLYSDNGEGIDPESLDHFGKRFYTSKLGTDSIDNSDPNQPLKILESVNTFGFRGEAIHSLLSISNSMIIISRVKEYNSGFKVCFVESRRLGNILKHDLVVPVGTNIRVIGLFDPLLVRKKYFFDNIDKNWNSVIFDIKKAIFNSLVDHPHVKIEIFKEEFKKDKWNKKPIIKKTGNSVDEKIPFQLQTNLFKNIFGKKICEDFEIFKVQFKDFHLRAGIGLNTIQTKNYQFMYLNGRPFLNEELFKSVNQNFQKKYDLWGYDIRRENKSKIINKTNTIYGKPYSNNPIFIAKFTINMEVSDFIYDPTKSCYNVRQLKILESLFFKIIDVYFGIFQKQQTQNKGNLKGKCITKKIEKQNASKIIKDAAILKSNMRVSKIRDFETNGRLKLNKSNNNKTNLILNFEQIRNGLNNKIENIQDGEETEDNQTEIKSDKDEEDSDHGCGRCYQVLSQEEIERKSDFFQDVENLELTREDLANFEIIGQADKKFIIVKNGKHIIVLDQHAADERIILERKYKELIEKCVDEWQTSNKKFSAFSIQIDLNETELDLIKKHEKALLFWGIQFDHNYQKIIKIPDMIYQKLGKISEDVLKRGLLEYVYNLEDFVKLSFGTMMVAKSEVNAKTNFWWVKFVPQLPTLYKEIIKSKACRSAIMFGNELSRQQMEDLITELHKCFEPFVCAHGRPSVYPVCVL